jgi:hypothetical protein
MTRETIKIMPDMKTILAALIALGIVIFFLNQEIIFPDMIKELKSKANLDIFRGTKPVNITLDSYEPAQFSIYPKGKIRTLSIEGTTKEINIGDQNFLLPNSSVFSIGNLGGAISIDADSSTITIDGISNSVDFSDKTLSSEKEFTVRSMFTFKKFESEGISFYNLNFRHCTGQINDVTITSDIDISDFEGTIKMDGRKLELSGYIKKVRVDGNSI